MATEYKHCQSCGMPMKRDEMGGGNADGSRSRIYCSHCQGQFLLTGINAEQMRARVRVS